MKLKIKETAWGITRATGAYKEKKTAEEHFPCEIGALPEFGKGKRHFTVDAIEEESIRLSVHCADPKYNKTWILRKGEEAVYRPRSFDGGYFYKFKLV